MELHFMDQILEKNYLGTIIVDNCFSLLETSNKPITFEISTKTFNNCPSHNNKVLENDEHNV